MLPRPLARLCALCHEAFSRLPAEADPAPEELLPAAVSTLASMSVPPLVASMACVALAGLVFSGPTMSWHAVAPRLDRLDPAAGLGRLLSADRIVPLLKDVVKLAVILALGAACLRGAVRPALAAMGIPPQGGVAILGHLVLDLAALLAAAAAAFAVADAAWSWHAWIRRQRMTVREMRQELRETEGDPSIKGRRRRIHREIAEHRMIELVRRATVIVVNPTHVAVALRWDESEMEAPAVVASGREVLAQRIIREARRSGVPIVRDPGLARMLSDLAPGETIPEDLYEAVAAILRALQEEGG